MNIANENERRYLHSAIKNLLSNAFPLMNTDP